MFNSEFLQLTEEEMIEAGVLDASACVDVIEEAFGLVSKGDYLLGGPSQNEHGIMIHFPKETPFEGMPIAGTDRRFMSLVAYLGGRFHICGNKWYGSNVANKEKGLPRSIHTIMLNDVETGAPKCLMCGNLISAMRTGAVPGVAARYLAPEGAKTLALIGAGVINRAAVRCIRVGMPDLKVVKVYDIFKDKANALCQEISRELDVEAYATDSMEEAIRDSDVIHFASSGKNKPFIPAEWLKPEVLLEISADVEYSRDLVYQSNLVLDQIKMHQAWYDNDKENHLSSYELMCMLEDGSLKRDQIMNLGDIVCGMGTGKYRNGKTTMFIANGLPSWDVAWAYQVYLNAKKKGLGRNIRLWDTPHWA